MAEKKTTEISICPWLYNADFAYSVAYDEGHLEVLANAYPVHEKYGIPAHLPVIAGQLGQRRNCYRSTSNGYFHLGVEHLKFLLQQGWSVGCHSYSHFVYPEQPGLDLDREIVYAKTFLESQIESPVTLFTIPNLHDYHSIALPYVRKAGYLACKYPVTGDLNPPDFDPLKIFGVRLGSDPEAQGFGGQRALRTETFDPSVLQGKWLYETSHLVQHVPDHPRKNIATADLELRLKTLRESAGNRFWAAVPEDVIDYSLLRRGCRILRVKPNHFSLKVDYPVGIRQRQLTFQIENPGGPVRFVSFDGKIIPVESRENQLLFTIPDVDQGKPETTHHLEIHN